MSNTPKPMTTPLAVRTELDEARIIARFTQPSGERGVSLDRLRLAFERTVTVTR